MGDSYIEWISCWNQGLLDVAGWVEVSFGKFFFISEMLHSSSFLNVKLSQAGSVCFHEAWKVLSELFWALFLSGFFFPLNLFHSSANVGFSSSLLNSPSWHNIHSQRLCLPIGIVSIGSLLHCPICCSSVRINCEQLVPPPQASHARNVKNWCSGRWSVVLVLMVLITCLLWRMPVSKHSWRGVRFLALSISGLGCKCFPCA